MTKQLNMAMIGGGINSLIGPVHWKSAILFNQAKLVAGVFSSDAERSKASTSQYNLSSDRGFKNIEELIAWDKQRAPEEQINFFTVCTPNHLHCSNARKALEAGYHVVCDKPLSHSIDEAREFTDYVRKSKQVFAFTHNYTGYPMIRYLRSLIKHGELGEILAVRLRYIQGWLATPLENTGNKQAAWRTDPSKSGVAGCFADIGTHAFNLLRFTTGLKPEKISAHLRSFIPKRQLDDYGMATMVMDNNALVHLTASQVSHGYRNHFYLEVDGSKATASWCQENPELLTIRRNQSGDQHIHREQVSNDDAYVRNASSLPAGHPEGYLEAFANIYKDAFTAMRCVDAGQKFDGDILLFPNIEDAWEGMQFIYRSVESSDKDGAWLKF